MKMEKKRALKDYYPKAMSEEEIDAVLAGMTEDEKAELLDETGVAMDKAIKKLENAAYVIDALGRDNEKNETKNEFYSNEIDDAGICASSLQYEAYMYRKYKAEIEKMIARDSAKVMQVRNIDYCISNVSLDQVKNLIENTEGDITIHICLTKEDLSE